MNKFVGLSYGAYPAKIAKTIKCDIEEATRIFNKYHQELYPGVHEMREKVLKCATLNKRIHLGLGCYINTSNPDKDIRSIFNACSQYWSILTLLAIHQFNNLVENKKIEVCCTIYDSIYIHCKDDINIIKWVNDTIIPLLTQDFLKDTIVHNEAEGEIGYNWYDTVSIKNNASLKDIVEAKKLLTQD